MPMSKVEKSSKYREGRNSHIPGEPFKDMRSSKNIYKDYGYQTSGYYYLRGWESAEREYRERERLKSVPKCPICGEFMDELKSGQVCKDTKECGYHSHREI